ncbi:MAG: ABC transporter permease [Deltaproteobacteria bacterium]|nr:ABC transporter permease [Deltaproteobacteria bacterium]
MRAYLIRRLIAIIPTLFIAVLIIFCMMRFIPGSVIDLILINADVGEVEVTRQSIEAALGFDKPVYIQFFIWLKEVVIHGNLGESLWSGDAVTDLILNKIPISLELNIIGLIFGIFIAIPIGIYSAIRQDTFLDYLGRSTAIIGMSIPNFWLATVIIVFPAIWWGYSPSIDLPLLTEEPWQNIKTFIVPAFVQGAVLAGFVMRFVRTMMLETLRQDYIRTAWAKGMKERVVVIRHALRNALVPFVTILGMMIPRMIGGSIVVETIFVLPGMGLLLYNSVLQRDYPVVSGVMLIMAVFVLLSNLLVDISYGYLDPRVRYR